MNVQVFCISRSVYCISKVPRTYFLSTVIFNFDYVFFLAYIAILSHWVSATKEPLSGSQKRLKTPFLWPTNGSFVALTQCDKLVLKKCQKKETCLKLKIIVIRKIRLGCLFFTFTIFPVFLVTYHDIWSFLLSFVYTSFLASILFHAKIIVIKKISLIYSKSISLKAIAQMVIKW